MKRSPMPQRSAPLRRAPAEARLSVPVFRPKRCASCREQFTPARTLQKVCGAACGLVLAKAQREKQERADTRAKREAMKPRAQWLREAQQAFNEWVRWRDAALPCVSCGRHHDGQYHAGHYLTTGARPELRFAPTNVHKQCSACNTHLHGNLVLYRAELIRRVGLAEVERLEGPHPPAKFDIPTLKEIRDRYRALTRALKKQPEGA